MKLSEAIEQDLPLVVDHLLGGLRYAPEVFIVPEGVVFLDFGWYGSSTHAIHMIEGKLKGSGPWKIGGATIRQLERTDRVYGELEMWKRFRLSEEGKLATREAARKYMCSTYEYPE